MGLVSREWPRRRRGFLIGRIQVNCVIDLIRVDDDACAI
jgi:hypothetical protein